MKELLHINIGALIFKPPFGKPGKGTGLLVSPNLVLTCAHNIVNFYSKQEYSDFKFYPGQSGPLE